MKISPACLKQHLRHTELPRKPRGADFKAACVFLLLFDIDHAPRILAIQKADNEGYPWRNQVALPGGHVDRRDNDPLSAAYRELKEEVNIPPEHVTFIGSMGHFQTIFNRDVEVFIGLWNGKSEIRYDPSEIAKMVTIPVADLVRTHHEGDFWGRLPDVMELLYPCDDVTVWGLTAKILHFFIEMMQPCLTASNCSPA